MAQDSPLEEITRLPRYACRRIRIIARTGNSLYRYRATVRTLAHRSHFQSVLSEVTCCRAVFGGGLLKTKRLGEARGAFVFIEGRGKMKKYAATQSRIA